MKPYYCWKCKTSMPFLDEDEWQQVSPLIMKAAEEIKKYRYNHNCDLATARDNVKSEATKKFEDLTGMPGVYFEIIHHHRLIDWGPECKKCSHLFRTPNASYCANCGQTIEENT